MCPPHITHHEVMIDVGYYDDDWSVFVHPFWNKTTAIVSRVESMNTIPTIRRLALILSSGDPTHALQWPHFQVFTVR